MQTTEEAEALLAGGGSQIEALLGERLYSRTGEPLEEVVGSLLRRGHATLSVAESLTGGMVGERITGIAGAPSISWVASSTYTDAMKASLLGVPERCCPEHTAVSEPVAIAMAEGARRITGSTYGLSLTGYAGPGGDSGSRFYGAGNTPAVGGGPVAFQCGPAPDPHHRHEHGAGSVTPPAAIRHSVGRDCQSRAG